MPSPAVMLRPVVEADQGLLLRVYASTRASELALTGWDALTCEAFVRRQFDAQRTHYRQHWRAADHSVIEVRSRGALQPVGRLWVDRRADTIHILDIALLPEWRGHGIGTQCLRQLMNEATHSGRVVTMHVEQDNPARRLYDRLGFESTGLQQGLHQLMTWRHRPGAASIHKEACDEQA